MVKLFVEEDVFIAYLYNQVEDDKERRKLFRMGKDFYAIYGLYLVRR